MEKKEFLKQLPEKQLQRFLNKYNNRVEHKNFAFETTPPINKQKFFDMWVEHQEEDGKNEGWTILSPTDYLDFAEEYWV